MKKILSITLATLVAISASAASLDWSVASKSFTTSDGSSARAGGYLVTVFYATDFSSVQGAIADLVSATATANSTGITSAISSIDALTKGTGVTKATGATSGIIDDSSIALGTELNIFIVAWDANSIADATSYLVSDFASTTAYTAPTTPTTNGAFESSSFGNAKWTAVPEPASAMLALAGVAMLIRRRK